MARAPPKDQPAADRKQRLGQVAWRIASACQAPTWCTSRFTPTLAGPGQFGQLEAGQGHANRRNGRPDDRSSPVQPDKADRHTQHDLHPVPRRSAQTPYTSKPKSDTNGDDNDRWTTMRRRQKRARCVRASPPKPADFEQARVGIDLPFLTGAEAVLAYKRCARRLPSKTHRWAGRSAIAIARSLAATPVPWTSSST
jgi:hypothetical protein